MILHNVHYGYAQTALLVGGVYVYGTYPRLLCSVSEGYGHSLRIKFICPQVNHVGIGSSPMVTARLEVCNCQKCLCML